MPDVSLNFNQLWTQGYAKIQSQIQIPPDLQQTVGEGGAVVYKKIEKKLHSLSLLNGLNVHGVIGGITGVMIPQLQNISTALDQSQSVLTPSMLSQMPGMSFNIGNLMNIIPQELMDEIFKAMPADVGSAFSGIMALTQNVQTGNFGGYTTNNRINPEVFIVKAVELLKNVTNLNELINALVQLMTDTDLYGLDTLANTSIDIGGTYGPFKLTIDGKGNVSTDLSNEFNQILQAFTGGLNGTQTTSGSLLDQVKDAPQMLARHAPQIESTIKNNLSTVPGLDAYKYFYG